MATKQRGDGRKTHHMNWIFNTWNWFPGGAPTETTYVKIYIYINVKIWIIEYIHIYIYLYYILISEMVSTSTTVICRVLGQNASPFHYSPHPWVEMAPPLASRIWLFGIYILYLSSWSLTKKAQNVGNWSEYLVLLKQWLGKIAGLHSSLSTLCKAIMLGRWDEI